MAPGTMCSGRRRRAAASAPRRALADDVGDQALVAGGVLANVGDRLADAGVSGQDGLDLAQLDPEAAQLHLVVGAAEELEPAVGAPAAPRRRSGTSGAPSAERVGDEALRASARGAPGSRGRGRRRRCRARRGRRPEPAAPAGRERSRRCSAIGRADRDGVGAAAAPAGRSTRRSSRWARTCSRRPSRRVAPAAQQRGRHASPPKMTRSSAARRPSGLDQLRQVAGVAFKTLTPLLPEPRRAAAGSTASSAPGDHQPATVEQRPLELPGPRSRTPERQRVHTGLPGLKPPARRPCRRRWRGCGARPPPPSAVPSSPRCRSRRPGRLGARRGTGACGLAPAGPRSQADGAGRRGEASEQGSRRVRTRGVAVTRMKSTRSAGCSGSSGGRRHRP